MLVATGKATIDDTQTTINTTMTANNKTTITATEGITEATIVGTGTEDIEGLNVHFD